MKGSWGVVGEVELITYTLEVRESCNRMDFREELACSFSVRHYADFYKLLACEAIEGERKMKD